MTSEANTESLLDILDSLADDLDAAGPLLASDGPAIDDPPPTANSTLTGPPSEALPSARPSRRSSLPPSMRPSSPDSGWPDSIHGRRPGSREAVGPVRRVYPFEGIPSSKRSYPDIPHRAEPAVRVRGSAARVLASFKWI
jgi:hypothetical protein